MLQCRGRSAAGGAPQSTTTGPLGLFAYVSRGANQDATDGRAMQRWLIGALLTFAAFALIWIIDLDPGLSGMRQSAFASRLMPIHWTETIKSGPAADEAASAEAADDPGSVNMAPHLALPDLVALMAQE